MDRLNQQHKNIARENVTQKHNHWSTEDTKGVNRKLEVDTPILMKHEYFRSLIHIYSLQLISK
jgi:hypothetical protein